MVSGEELYERGRHLATRGRYREARRVLSSAIARAAADGDVELEARVAGTQAYVLARLGSVGAGERLCLDALAREGLSATTIAQLHGQLGALAIERGLLDDAAEWLGKSIEGLADQPVRQANTRLNRSLVFMQRGMLDEALADLEAAEQSYRAADMIMESNLTVHNRGYVKMLAGDLVAALQTMQSVRERLDEESELWAAINELDRAEVLREAGLVTEAERSLGEVAVALERHHAPREHATAEYQLARSLLSHDPVAASTAADRAARRFRRVGSTGWAARADAIRLRARLAVGRIDRAGDPVRLPGRLPSRASVEAVVQELDALGFRGEAEALRLAHTLARVRRNSAAELPRLRVDRHMPLESALLAQELRAVHAALNGSERDAQRHAARGLTLLDAAFGDGGSLDLLSSSAMRGAGLITTGLASALRSRDPARVFEWSEYARLDSERIVPVRPSPDPEQAADLAELRVLRMANSDADWLSGPRARMLRDRARQRQWSTVGVAGVHQRATLEQARGELRDGGALACFVFDGERLAVLVVTPHRTAVIPLDWSACRHALRGLRADLDVSAAVTSGPMAGVVRDALADRLAVLSKELIEPWLGVTGPVSHLAIAAPGVLTVVPWAMLPGLRGSAISLAGSATGWIRRRGLHRQRPRIAGFASGPRVARGEEEIARAATAWHDVVMRSGAEATVSGVTSLAESADVLHIAAHGRHAVDNPMFSGLELYDGTLFGYDIDLVESVPGTVVLSACEVGRSSVRWGEEAVGMTRTWLHAGARSVVAAPVIVADDEACELLAAMHEGLAAGIAPSVALAEASERTGIVAPFQVHGAGF